MKKSKETLPAIPADNVNRVGTHSGELTPQGQIDALVSSMQQIIKYDPVRGTINGLPALVSSSSLQLSHEGEETYAFIAELEDTDKVEAYPFVVFGDKHGSNIATPNPNAIRFRELDGQVVMVVDHPDGPVVNSAQNALEITKIINGLVEQRATDLAVAKQAAEAEALAHRQIKRSNRAHRWESTKRFAFRTIGVVCLAGALGGATYGLKQVDWDKIGESGYEKFDDHHYKRPEGTIVEVGDTETPLYSASLYDEKAFARSEMHTIDKTGGGKGENLDTSLGLDDSMRQVIIESSKSGKNCEEVPLSDDTPLGTEAVALTDFTSPDGKSRANELKVTHKLKQLTVCWQGQELNDDDDPRVVVYLQK